MSRKSGGGGGGGGRSVQVSGYTRSNGTYVPSYTRAAPSSSRSSASSVSGSVGRSSGSGSGTVQVSGYTRSDGKCVQGYTRSTPSSSRQSANTSQSTASPASSGWEVGTVQVRSYTRSDGTVVQGHTRSTPSSSKQSTSPSQPTANTNSSTKSSGASKSRVYVDNAYNRKLGRVGRPLGSCVVSSTPSPASASVGNERTYVDNPMNRRLGRAGKPIPKRGRKQQEILENITYEELLDILRNMGFEDETRVHYQLALNQLHRTEVEVTWKSSGIEPHTELESVKGFTPGIIPFEDLDLQPQIIGRGAFAEVYAAVWHETPVAFKQLIYQGMSKKRCDSFVQEVKILGELNHPNTVKLFGAVVDNGHLGIVMEYLPRTLFQAIFIDISEFDETVKKRQITQIADALSYLHKNSIAHCDVKSENVLLDKEDNAKLSDFGLSAVKKATESSRSSLAVPPGQGTPRYSAPEVLRGQLLNFEQLRHADVYSLAIVAFEVLAEEEPFEGLSVKQLEENVGRGDLRPDVPSRVSEMVHELMQRCWDAVSSRRPSAEEFKKLWEISTLYES